VDHHCTTPAPLTPPPTAPPTRWAVNATVYVNRYRWLGCLTFKSYDSVYPVPMMMMMGMMMLVMMLPFAFDALLWLLLLSAFVLVEPRPSGRLHDSI